jgi:hypothetical protein
MSSSKPIDHVPDWKRREGQLRGARKCRGVRRSEASKQLAEEALALPKITIADGSEQP